MCARFYIKGYLQLLYIIFLITIENVKFDIFCRIFLNNMFEISTGIQVVIKVD